MPLLTSILLTLTLVLCGAYAGLMLMCQIGVLPAMRHLSPHAYADAWRAIDHYMARSMPPYKGSLLLVNLAATLCVTALHYRALVVASGMSFLCGLAGLILTLRQQLPLNDKLKALTSDASDSAIVQIREQTIRNFSIRFALAAVAFIALSAGLIAWPMQ